jgi:hypothetical protein
VGKKRDIKQFEDACRTAGLSEVERKLVRQAYHEWKLVLGSGDLTFASLVVWLRDWKADR